MSNKRMSNKQSYEGSRITVYFDASRCIHAGRCVKGLPDVFRVGSGEPWIAPDAASADDIAELCNTCPSGALGYHRKDGGAEEARPEINSISVEVDGPLTVHADFTLNGENPRGFRASVCRCGASKNKPWCDGSHTETGFSAPGDVAPFNPDADTDAGRLDIKPFKNGPLFMAGPLSIRDSHGQTARDCEKTGLCRCGGSRHKPYCDGTHAEIGFESE